MLPVYQDTRSGLILTVQLGSTVKLGDKEQIGVKEPFPVTNLKIY